MSDLVELNKMIRVKQNVENKIQNFLICHAVDIRRHRSHWSLHGFTWRDTLYNEPRSVFSKVGGR